MASLVSPLGNNESIHVYTILMGQSYDNKKNTTEGWVRMAESIKGR